MSHMELMLRDYRLTTADILYHLPDYPKLLQSYVWQEYDIAPKFPSLCKFLEFWQRELDGKLHSVRVTSAGLINDAQFRYAKGELLIH